MKQHNQKDRSDCKYYDYGDTAPREYGVFCSRNQTRTNVEKCSKCKFYIKDGGAKLC